MTTITAIILTFNEEIHIERCISSLKSSVSEIIVVDSYSTDNTIKIVNNLGAKTYQNPFVNQAIQFNWALQNCEINSHWILRIDADEYLENKTNLNICQYLNKLPKFTNGLLITRKIIFMEQALMHGGWYPKYNLRIFRKGYGVSENRWMDEHIVISEGNVEKIDLDFVDENLNDLTWWINKHNNYANREAIDFFMKKNEDNNDVIPNLFGNEAEKKRWLKGKYNSIPLFVRPFLNFVYRYIFKLGFLDGKSGLVWHVLQGFWYRFLVDAKIYELKKRFKGDDEAIISYIKNTYKID